MGDEMKQAETGMPSLTLEPDFAPEVKKEPEVQVQGQLMEVAPEMDPVQQKMAQTVLTPEEQKMVDDFASKIDVENLTQVMQYGAGTQKKMAVEQHIKPGQGPRMLFPSSMHSGRKQPQK